MPIYEFRCTECGHVQEIIVSRVSEEVQMKCEECQGESLDRILSSVNYAMGDSSAGATQDRNSSLCATTRNCGQNSCTTLNLPGYTK